jgi:pimeloyl-ACP methyl ester carboxylesterase
VRRPVLLLITASLFDLTLLVTPHVPYGRAPVLLAQSRAPPSAPGDSLNVESIGAGPLVVLLPGLFGSAYGFRRVTPLLTGAGFRVVIIEPLGVGTSGRPADADYSLTAQSERIAVVLDTLQGGPAVIVAHSLAGSMAFRLAVAHPELVRGIVSLEGGPVERAATPGFRGAMKAAPLLRLLGGGRVRSTIRGGLRESSGDPSWVTESVVRGYTEGATRDLGATLRAYQAMARATEPESLAPNLIRLRTPVRLLVGGAPHAGGLDPREITLLRTRLESFAVDTIPGVGHYIQEEQPSAVLTAVEHVVVTADVASRASPAAPGPDPLIPGP